MGPVEPLRVPGIEAVGEIISDPMNVFKPGQKVATAMGGMQFVRNGSYAEEVVVLRNNVIPLGDTNLSWEELAALPQAYLTVWGALSKSLGISAGQTLLVRGATSSVGTAAVAYAAALGVDVIATTRSKEKVNKLYEAGAKYVVIDNGNISEEVKNLIPNGVDSALEVVGVSTLLDTAKTIKPFGQVTVIGSLGGASVLKELNLMSDLPSAVKINFFPSQLLGTEFLPLSDAPLRMVIEGIENKVIPSLLAKVFEFDEVAEAHRTIESDHNVGKLVVRV